MRFGIITSLMATSTIALAGVRTDVNLMLGNASSQVVKHAPQSASTVEGSFLYGYTYPDKPSDGLRCGTAPTIYAYMKMPDYMTKSYAGCKIMTMNMGINRADNPVKAQVIITHKMDGTPLYTQDVELLPDQWNTVQLTTPFTIEAGQDLYIGYSVASTGEDYPVGYEPSCETMAAYAVLSPIVEYIGYWKDGEYKYGVLDNLMWSSKRILANFCLNVELQGELPENNVVINKTAPYNYYLHQGEANSLVGLFTNIATQPLYSYMLNYSIDDQPEVSEYYDCNLDPHYSASFVIPNLPTSQEGLHTVRVSISDPNGSADDDESDNTYTTSYLCYNDSVKRNVLFEHFTTQKCINCPLFDERIDEALSGKDDVIAVAHHAGFGTDNFTTPEDLAFEWFYGSTTYIWAPAGMYDRTNLKAYGATGYGGTTPPGPVFAMRTPESIEALYESALNQPTFVQIEVAQAFDPETRNLKVSVQANSIYDLPLAQNLKLNVFLVEDGVVDYQMKQDNTADLNYVHNGVYRKSLTGTWGDAIAFEDGKLQREYNVILPEKFKACNMRAVAFIAYYDETNVNGSQVLNAAQVPVVDPTGLAQISIAGEGEVRVYSTSGELVAKGQGSAPELKGLTPGIYLLQWSNGSGTTKVVVK